MIAPWWIVLGIYFISATASTLQRRAYTQHTAYSSAVVSFLSHTFFILPFGLAYVFYSGLPETPFTAASIFYSLIAAILWVIITITSFNAQKELDSAQIAIIVNIYTPITVLISAILLEEGLTFIQIVGMLMLVAGAIIVSVKGFTRETFTFTRLTLLGLFSGVALGFCLAAERAAIKEGGLASYLLVGWGLQALVAGIVALPEITQWPKALKTEGKNLLEMGILRFGQLFCFMLAAQLSTNLALISSLTTFRIVLVFVAGYFFLRERDNLTRKLVGCALATIGLLIS